MPLFVPVVFTLAGTKNSTQYCCLHGLLQEWGENIKWRNKRRTKSHKNIRNQVGKCGGKSIKIKNMFKGDRTRQSKEYAEWTVLHATTVSAVTKAVILSPLYSIVLFPFTVWFIRAAFAVGTKFKKAAWEFLCPVRTAVHGPLAERQQSPPLKPGQWWIWTVKIKTRHITIYHRSTGTRIARLPKQNKKINLFKITLAHLSWNIYKSKLFIEFWWRTRKKSDNR